MPVIGAIITGEIFLYGSIQDDPQDNPESFTAPQILRASLSVAAGEYPLWTTNSAVPLGNEFDLDFTFGDKKVGVGFVDFDGGLGASPYVVEFGGIGFSYEGVRYEAAPLAHKEFDESQVSTAHKVFVSYFE